MLKGRHEEMIGAKAATEKLLREEQGLKLPASQQRKTNLTRTKHSAMRAARFVPTCNLTSQCRCRSQPS